MEEYTDAQVGRAIDALHHLRAEVDTSFGHMYLDEIHAILTGDEVCFDGCPIYNKQVNGS